MSLKKIVESLLNNSKKGERKSFFLAFYEFYRVRIETEQGTLTKQSQRAEDTKKGKVERGEKQVSWRCRGVA